MWKQLCSLQTNSLCNTLQAAIHQQNGCRKRNLPRVAYFIWLIDLMKPIQQKQFVFFSKHSKHNLTQEWKKKKKKKIYIFSLLEDSNLFTKQILVMMEEIKMQLFSRNHLAFCHFMSIFPHDWESTIIVQ